MSSLGLYASPHLIQCLRYIFILFAVFDRAIIPQHPYPTHIQHTYII